MGRVRIASLGVVDILRGDLPPPGVQQAQALFAQDLAALGQLLLSLMCAGVSQGPSLDAAAQSFSPDLVGLAASLMEAPAGGGIHGVEQLVAAISGRMCVEFGSLGAGLDRLTGELEVRASRSSTQRQSLLMTILPKFHGLLSL